jgi:hypothetical protein
MKNYICIGMAVLMSNFPSIALAVTSDEMISTAAVVEQLTRADAERKVIDTVNVAEVRAKLLTLGITPQEISGKLASLSDSELRQMAKQMEQARYGGDGGASILIIVVLVLLIIFLARRI